MQCLADIYSLLLSDIVENKEYFLNNLYPLHVIEANIYIYILFLHQIYDPVEKIQTVSGIA